MKLVITTQTCENYGAHSWDGEGQCPQYWKFKGGNTYVVENLNSAQVQKIADNGIPTLEKLIGEDNEYFKEYVINWQIVGDEDTCWDEWESPVVFYWGGDRWLAGRTILNDEYGYMRKGILAKREEWIPLEGGERGHYKCEYQTASGWYSEKEVMKQLEAA